MPEERVAIQPPSVECVKLSGKWPQVQPWALSWRSRSGPKTPACTRASCEVASTDSTRFRRPMSIEITGRVSSRSASRLPEMLDPPPNGITTASCLEGGPDDRGDLVLAGGADHDVGHPTQVPPALADQVA